MHWAPVRYRRPRGGAGRAGVPRGPRGWCPVPLTPPQAWTAAWLLARHRGFRWAQTEREELLGSLWVRGRVQVLCAFLTQVSGSCPLGGGSLLAAVWTRLSSTRMSWCHRSSRQRGTRPVLRLNPRHSRGGGHLSASQQPLPGARCPGWAQPQRQRILRAVPSTTACLKKYQESSRWLPCLFQVRVQKARVSHSFQHKPGILYLNFPLKDGVWRTGPASLRRARGSVFLERNLVRCRRPWAAQLLVYEADKEQ